GSSDVCSSDLDIIRGSRKCVITKPPIIKEIVATREGHWRLLIPIIECPEVHPPAYRVPNPTIKPPNTKKNKPFHVKMFSQLNISSGIILSNRVMPNKARSSCVEAAI